MANSPQSGASTSDELIVELGNLLGPDIEVIETHFAWIVLAGSFAYKLRRAVATHGFDLRSRAARKRACELELTLNAALAPGIYLEVVPLIRAPNGSLALTGRGETIDWVVKMRRLHRADMLDALMAQRRVTRDAVLVFARKLSEFYAHQPSVWPVDRSYVARLAAQLEANARDLLSGDLQLDPLAVKRTLEMQRAQLAAVADEIEERRQCVIEVHGDLRPEHIYLGDPPCVIDRLEFSADLRTMDPFEELAFLHVECSRADHAWVAQQVIQTHRAYTGDVVSPTLLAFYAAHRAIVRARITAWHLRDPATRHSKDWVSIAHAYLAHATGYLRRDPVL
jgi:aminoglycoside phosphotransferase family enzyme